jgi:hypothetical protein
MSATANRLNATRPAARLRATTATQHAREAPVARQGATNGAKTTTDTGLLPFAAPGGAEDAAEECVEAAMAAVVYFHDTYLSERLADEGGRLVSAYGEACRRAGRLEGRGGEDG